ncbi:hypothetical protein DWF00_09515 [Bosea caraganae]|uniref:Flagellar protein FlaG n=1 Tax=Bosea caraganae TaxID=2763117 RepID=A0A370LBL9_9HYPH|nr:hypothetical protein [Bosea caraganae]RDJ27223.1 hypothetical protein DWF00_09515 [Bosea caraganae]RDJ29240.1 hypothetical protein DWE98_01290 [Bosea caraganae]
MDFGSPTKASAVGVFAAAARTDALATRGSIPVDLPPEQTVQSANAGEAVRLDLKARSEQAARDEAARQQGDTRRQADRQREQAMRDVIERRIVIDPRTRAVVYQKTDRSTGETITQLPTEAMLKLRIYSRELTERARQAEAEGGTAQYVERTA